MLWVCEDHGREEPPMYQHPNARLTPMGRLTLVRRVEAGEKVARVAREMGTSRQTAHRWLARHRAGEPLTDRSSRPRRQARRTDPATELAVVAARLEERANLARLSARTGVPERTCARVLRRWGCPRLSDYDRVTGELLPRGPVTRVRYERAEPGEIVRVDVKKLPAVPEGGGSRARGPRKAEHQGHGGGTLCLHVAVDDRSRVCYAEMHGDERAATCVGFMRRMVAFFSGLGVRVDSVMTDNGPAYRSRALAEWLGSAGVRHRFTRSYSPWQNGKVERMNGTLAREWAYARPYAGERERAGALEEYLRYYNHERPHSACGGDVPMSRIRQQRDGS